MQEYQEKYDSYLSLNKILESYRYYYETSFAYLMNVEIGLLVQVLLSDAIQYLND